MTFSEQLTLSSNPPELTPVEPRQQFQKRHKLAHCLPYSVQLEESRLQAWAQLKEHFSSALLEGGPSLALWVSQMDFYLSIHSFAFTKAEHIQLVQGLWTAVQHLDDDLPTLAKVVPLLSRLVENHRLLTKDDIQVEWRPLLYLYQLAYEQLPSGRKDTLRRPPELESSVFKLICYLKPYFKASFATEIIAHFRPYMCIYDDRRHKNALFTMLFFLPTTMTVDERASNLKDYQFWFERFFRCWMQLPLDSNRDSSYLNFFHPVAYKLNGYLNWEPYLPELFDRLLHLLDNEMTEPRRRVARNSLSVLIVYLINENSSVLKKLKTLLTGSSKFMHYTEVITGLLGKFILRVRDEKKGVDQRYWYFSTPTSHLLTPALIDDFAALIFDDVVFERLNLDNFPVKTLHELSLLCTKDFAEKLLKQKWALAKECASEPGRMRLVLQLLAVFLYPVLKNQTPHVQVAYQGQIKSILEETLSSLSTTDGNIAYLQLLFIRSVIWLNFGRAYKDSKEATWNAFNESFIGTCFTLVDSNCEDIFSRTEAKKVMKLIYEILLYSLAQIEDEEQCKIHINQIIDFGCSRIFDSSHTWDLLDNIMLPAMLVENLKKYAANRMLAKIEANIISAIDGEGLFADTFQNQLLHNIRLLQIFFSIEGEILLEHEETIVQLLTSVYSLQFDSHFKHAYLLTHILWSLFLTLGTVYLFDQPYRSVKSSKEVNSQLLLLVSPDELSARWHFPSEKEINFVRRLLQTFIIPQMQLLQKFANSSDEDQEFSSAQLEKSVAILKSIEGLKSQFYKMSHVVDDQINKHSFKYFNVHNSLADIFALNEKQLFDQQTDMSNFCLKLIQLLSDVSTKIQRLSNVENSKLLENVIKMIDFCFFPEETSNSSSDITDIIYLDLIKEKRRQAQVQHNKLDELHTKLFKATRVQNSKLTFTQAHQVALELLINLSLDRSPEVRQDAQKVLNVFWKTFPTAFEQLAVPRLLAALQLYNTNYDAFKGALYVLYGGSSYLESPLLSGSWAGFLLPLWPAIIAVNWVEKPAIALLVNEKLNKNFNKFVTQPIRRREDNFKAIESMLTNLNRFPSLNAKKCRQIEDEREKISLENEESYQLLIDSLLTALNEQKLHWRYLNIAMKMLEVLVRFDVPLPETALKPLLTNLIHDSVEVRETSLNSVWKVLFQHCRPNRKLTLMTDANYRSFDFSVDLTAEKNLYEKTTFVDYFFEGFQVEEGISFEVHVPTTERCNLYPVIVKKFSDEKFLNTLFYVFASSLDETKEFKTSWSFIRLWKYLFQSFKLFGSSSTLFTLFDELLCKRKPIHDKFVLEALNGLAKAMPWFNFEDYTTCKRFFEDVIFAKHLARFDALSENGWFYLFHGFFCNRDLRRSFWVWKILFANCSSSHSADLISSPFTLSKMIYFCIMACKRNWRFPVFNEQIIRTLEEQKFFSHPYNDVRDDVAKLLNRLFIPERLNLSHSSCSPAQPNARQLFVGKIVAQLEQKKFSSLLLSTFTSASEVDILLQLQKTLFDRKTVESRELLQFLDTVGNWITFSFCSSFYTDAKDFLPLLPYLCIVQTNNSDPIDDALLSIVGMMARELYTAEDAELLIPILEQMSVNWSKNCRKMTAGFMISFTAKNAFVLGESDKILEKWQEILLQLLQDEHLTVRLFAQKAFVYFWQLVLAKIQKKVALIEKFKAVLSSQLVPEMKVRHGAVLGLCAVVEAVSDSVPEYLPQLLIYLGGKINDLQPISETIKSTLRSFRASHIENWVHFKLAFTLDQLEKLDNVLISNLNYV